MRYRHAVRVCRGLVLLLSAWLTVPPAAFAENAPVPSDAPPASEAAPSDPPEDASLGEVVVTGTRNQETAFRSPRSVSILDSQQLSEQSPRTLPQALHEAPGVYVQETNYGGGSPIVRGLVGPQVLILFDGVRLNNATYRTGPLQYLNLIDQHSLDRVEVLLGAGSVLYGSDAMGGVIQVFPIKPRDWRQQEGFGYGGKATARYSSADKGQIYHAHADIGSGGFGLLGGGTLKFFGDVTGGRGTDPNPQPHTGYDQYAVTGQAVYRFTGGFVDNWSVSLGYLLSRMEDVGRAENLFAKKQVQFYDNDDHLLYGRLHMIFRPIDTRATLTLSYQNFYENRDSWNLTDNLRTRLSGSRDEIFVDTFGLDYGMDTRILGGRMWFTYGAMWYRDWVDSDRYARLIGGGWGKTERQSFPDGSTYDTFGGYLQVAGDPLHTDGGHILRLSGGYRLHGFVAQAPAQGDLLGADFSKIGHVGTASLQYLYRDHANLGFTWSQGFRAPNLQETAMLGDTGDYFERPNSALRPESANTLELHARGRLWRVTAGWTGHLTLLDDLLKRVDAEYEGQTTINGKTVKMHTNGQSGRLYGTEAHLGVEIAWGLSLAGHLTYTWGKEEVPDAADVPLSKIPPLFGQLTLRWDTERKGNWRGFIETYFRGATKQDRLSPTDQTDIRIPEGGTPSWWTWNLRTGLVGFDTFRVGLVVENLLDKQYKYHASGVYAPGTNAMLTLEVFH